MKTKVIVDRTRWLRGEGAASSYLLRPTDGKMCCLGFACLALGLTDEQIRSSKSPGSACRNELGERIPGVAGVLDGKLTTTSLQDGKVWHKANVGQAMEINDSETMNDEEREIHLKNLLGDVFDLEFIG